MERVEATFRVVTPMFLSGADQSRAELRLPSIKGALRFWWRALAWERLGDLDTVRQEEAQLFGSTDTGQAGVLMRLSPAQALEIAKGKVLQDNGRTVGDGARYLGYGVMEAFASSKKGTQPGQLTRACLAAPFTFTLQLSFKASVSQAQRDSIVKAFKLLGLIGALGSKARKGYGSLVLTALSGEGVTWRPPQTLQELRDVLEVFRATRSDPPYTALSHQSRFVLIEGGASDSPLGLLNRIGRELVFYRSWGNNGKVLNGQAAEQNFVDDHDLMKAIAGGGSVPSSVQIDHPERVAFGLPHNYFFSSTKDKVDVKAILDKTSIERRASPLFIHIHELGERPAAVLSFLPSQFLPNVAKICMVGKLQSDAQVAESDELWQPIHEFLDRIQNVGAQSHLKRKEQFGNVVEVPHGRG